MPRVPTPARVLHLGHLLCLSSLGATHPTPSWDLPAPRRVPPDLRPAPCLAHPATLPPPLCERVTRSAGRQTLAPDHLCSRHAAGTKARAAGLDDDSNRGPPPPRPRLCSTLASACPRSPATWGGSPTPLPLGPDGQQGGIVLDGAGEGRVLGQGSR